MREHHAVRVDVLRSALAVVGVLGGGAGAHACEYRICPREYVTAHVTAVHVHVCGNENERQSYDSYRPSICRRPTSARIARWWWWLRGVAVVAALALATRDSALTPQNPRYWVDLGERFRRRRRARYPRFPGTFGERSAETRSNR